MAKFFPMFSGSDGNATYIGNSVGGVLVDVGVSFKRIKNSLVSAGLTLEDVKAILITHEHNDHIKGLKVFLKNRTVPIVASRDTVYALEYAGAISYDTPRIYIDETPSADFDGIKVSRFPTSHDCAGSSGYVVELDGETKTAVCTDLGVMTDEVFAAISGAQTVLLESNHDPVMLRLGPYPAELKLRIGSDKGHLSNAICADTLAKLYEKGAVRFILGHLSEINNTPEKAAASARAALIDKGAKENSDYILYVAPKEGSRVISI